MLVGVIAFVVGVGAVSHFWGNGAIHLLLPADQFVEVEIDGQPAPAPESRGGHHRYGLSRGKHRVRITANHGTVTDYPLELNSGLDELLLPSSEGQCFVSVAVSGNDTWQGAPPQILNRHPDHNPVPVAGAYYVGFEELPVIRRGGGILIEVVACDQLGKTDGELIALLGL